MSKYLIKLIFCGIILITFGCAGQPTPISTPTILSPTATLSVIVSEAIPEIDTMFTNLADEGLFSGAVLVAYQGEVLLSKGYGFADRDRKIANTPQTQFQIASVTKQFTAVAILILQEQSKVSVSDPICNFIVNCPTMWQEITIHHLLTHTSGIPNYDYRELGIYQSPDDTAWSPEAFVTVIKKWPLDFQPGEKWSYSNSGYIILGYIIEQVTGQPYETFLC